MDVPHDKPECRRGQRSKRIRGQPLQRLPACSSCMFAPSEGERRKQELSDIPNGTLVQRTRLHWSPTRPWQHHALAPILSVCCRTRRLSSWGAQVDCQWSSYVTANRIGSSASVARKALLEYLPNGAGRPPEIYRHHLGTESGSARGNREKLLCRAVAGAVEDIWRTFRLS